MNKKLSGKPGAVQRVRLAVAFWGDGAGDAIGLEVGDDVRIVCNLTSGGTNPEEIRSLIRQKFDVRHLRGLHAKLGVVGKTSFVGSSNMSANGLGLEAATQGWSEINVVYDRPREEIETQFEAFWNAAHPVDDAILKRAERSWAIAQTAKARISLSVRDGDATILDILKRDPEALDDLPAIVVVYKASESPELRKANKKVRNDHGEMWECYEDWNDLPSDCYIFDFAEENGKLEWVGLFRRLPDVPGPPGFQAAKKIKSIEGYGIGSGSPNRMLSAMKRLAGQGQLRDRDDGNGAFFLVSRMAHAMIENE